MEVNLGIYKLHFVAEDVFGTNTVSLDTLEQSKLKIMYCSLRLCMQLLIELYFIMQNKQLYLEDFHVVTTYRWICLSMQVYRVLSAIYDYKTRISIALNLEAIDERLRMNQMANVGKQLTKIVSSSLLVIYVCTQMMWTFYYIYYARPEATVAEIGGKTITDVFNYGLTFQQASLFATFIMDQFFIEHAISKNLYKVNDVDSRGTGCSTTRRRRSRREKRREESELYKKQQVSKEILGFLKILENDTIKSFWFQVTIFRLLMEVLGPLLLITYYLLQKYFGLWEVLGMVCTHGFFLICLYVVERARNTKGQVHQQLVASRVVGEGRNPHHVQQLLASIHRSSEPFSCHLFDLDYSLLATIFENSSLIYTTLLSSYNSN